MNDRKMQVKVVVVAILAVLVIVLVAQNTEVVNVRILFWDIAMSRVVLILLATLFGFAGGFLVGNSTGRSAAGRRSPANDAGASK